MDFRNFEIEIVGKERRGLSAWPKQSEYDHIGVGLLVCYRLAVIGHVEVEDEMRLFDRFFFSPFGMK